jgi:hypothetical protein
LNAFEASNCLPYASLSYATNLHRFLQSIIPCRLLSFQVFAFPVFQSDHVRLAP